MKLLKGLLRLLNLGLVAVSMFALLAPHIDPRLFWPISFLGLGVPVLLVLNVLAAILFLRMGLRPTALQNVAVLLVFSLFLGRLIGFSGQGDKPEGDLSVLTFNTRLLDGDQRQSGYPTYKSLVKGHDFVAFQEANIETSRHRNFVPAMHDAGLTHHYKGNHSIKLFSRYPIINKGIVVGEESSVNGAVFIDVKIEDRILRVYGMHLKSTGIAGEADKVVTGDPHSDGRQTLQRILYILRRLKASNYSRSREVKQLAAHIQSSPYPVILCGDLNDTPFTFSYQQLKRHLQDAFVAHGRGLSTTYKGPIPGLRIDYIFMSESLVPTSYQRVRDHNSDHYPVTASFRWAAD